MGKLNMGILGGFSGTVGTVVGMTNKKGDDIIRGKSKKPRTSTTEGQLIQRTKFGLVTGFMQPFNQLLQIGCKSAAGSSMTPFNYACKMALSEAVTGDGADVMLNYAKVRLSEGQLGMATGVSVSIIDEKAKFVWNYGSGHAGNATDKAFMVVYNVDNNEMNISNALVSREDKGGEVVLPYCETGDKLLCYLFFQSATDSAIVSNSQLAGEITMSA